MEELSLPITVIVSTYNAERWLEKVLLGYFVQSHKRFEIVVADDGSGPETARLVATFADLGSVPVTHVWHEDRGYRRQEILNNAILHARYDYLVFTDGDCIPRRDFLKVHACLAQPGRFLSGGYCKLDMSTSMKIGADDIIDGTCFEPAWLRARQRLGMSNRLKLGSGPAAARFLDATTTARATFNNCNSSAWKRDILAVNGYDERMKYGGADRELGERLANAGITGLQIRHRAVCVHLDHDRPYRTAESLRDSREIRRETRRLRRVRTPFGIDRGLPHASPDGTGDRHGWHAALPSREEHGRSG
ncbi:glycosyltransferase [Pseudoxanthomonas putridarboris]|uniref:Glycosyltransferase n=1 Tax=Pseudoxanthomonas putridarboris TaxID=752605 RepID=A0ABU9J599_9GAMM